MSDVDSIHITVLFLGPARDAAGAESQTISMPAGATIEALRDTLGKEFPRLKGALATVRFAINDEFASVDVALSDGDEVAIIPPVSGGAADVFVDLTNEPIDVARVQELVCGDPRFGGLVTFQGATRAERDDDHGELVRLDYEAHESMARKQMHRLASLALERWGEGRVAIVHRLGSVPPGEDSVVIAVAFGHRKEAFDACRWLIDALKVDVPIWKKDVFADGHVEWVEGATGFDIPTD